ncbi:MAG: 8-oxoguanine deaminase, partial [Acidimicrobiales bacterium]
MVEGRQGRLVVEGCAIVTVDRDPDGDAPAGTEIASGHLVMDGPRITAVGSGPAPAGGGGGGGGRRIDGRGCLATPGLVNTHHHLYQWLTRGLAQEATLFEWLTALYPVWAGLDEDMERAAARAGLSWLALSGCTTSADHHYLFPRGGGDLLGASVQAAREIGLRFYPTRGSMDLGRSSGGLPPDQVVEDLDQVLAATAAAVDAFHDPGPESMCRVGVAPCSPFSVTGELMSQSASLARDRDLRLHTHLAETLDEEAYCRERFGCRPSEYLESLGWLGHDVWLAHCVHLDGAGIESLARTGTGVAHCPSSNARLGSGLAPVAGMVGAGVTVGLGVDGAASQETGQLAPEMRQALYTARLRGGP